ncbi:MAG TPA: YceI family protein [Anaeromyxobacteraceae bacterium]|nr:YceI family protein [Anaeromyxobacteraceae bacterium]
MKNVARLLTAVTLALPALAFAEATTWKIDPAHTQTAFVVRHLGVSNVRGEFRTTNGTVVIDEQRPEKSRVEAVIDAKSIHTREEKRDAHLRSPDFFDAEKFPAITFKSTKVEKAGDAWKITGDLTLHGVTKPVTLEATVTKPIQGMRGPTRGVSATTKIRRGDFGLSWNKMVEAVPVVGDEVTIQIDAELNRQAETTASAK